MSNIVFVYGTLRNGQRLHRIILDRSKFVCNGTVRQHLIADYHGMFPIMFPTNDDKDIVYGEVHNVDDDAFEYIKRVELGAGYQMVNVDVHAENGDAILGAYAFIRKHYEEPIIECGDWVKFQNDLEKKTGGN